MAYWRDLTKHELILELDLWSLTLRELLKTRRLARHRTTLVTLLQQVRQAHKELIYGSTSRSAE